jgi:H+/Cl- antiporter ClcA
MIISIAAIRKHLALPKTSWQICLLAIIGGCASALLVVLFTLTIEQIQQLYLIKRDNYNSLDEVSRFDLPIIGSIIILLIAWLTGYKYLRTGIPFVLHRLKIAHGVIPFKNTLNQFWGSAVALASGFSVGREGPAVHLGAACSTYLGSLLKLPYNSIRTLCACGIAAGIAATFNTPIAAVIFVMEVIMREYKVHIFVPVMLAAIVGSLITRSVFGTSHNFQFFHTIALEQHHYFSLVLLAIFLGLLAAGFNKYLIVIIKKSVKFHIVPRLMLAALITGTLGYYIPEAMGTGTTAIDISLINNVSFNFLFSLLLAKLLMTMFALGLGIPGGIVGPTLSIGAIAGACAGALAVQLLPGEHLGSDFILMGMAGFMAASLNAPLAALLAVVELSGQLELVLPAMMVITIASIISRQLCKNESIFTMQLDAQNVLYRKPPIEESLQNIGVLAVMKDDLLIIEQASTRSITGELLNNHKSQFIINKEPASQNSEQGSYYWAQFDADIADDASENIEHNLAKKLILHKLIPLSHQATLAEAYLALVEQRCGAVYIYQESIDECIGLVTFEQLRIYLVEGKLV